MAIRLNPVVWFVAIPLSIIYALNNLVMFLVIKHNRALAKNSTFRLMSFMAVQETCMCCLSAVMWTMALVCCWWAPILEEKLFFSPNFCNVAGSILLAGLFSTAYGQLVVALDRFAAVFLYLRYKRLFTYRNSIVMWLVIVNGIPFAFFFPTMLNVVGGFVSYPGYCLCIPTPPGVGPLLWNLSVPTLIMIPLALSILIYAAIYVRIRLAHRRVGATAITPLASNAHAGTADTVSRRARNSLVFFVNVVAILVCMSAMASTAQAGYLDVEQIGARPVILFMLSLTQMGSSLGLAIVFNKKFRASFKQWLFSFGLLKRYYTLSASATSNAADNTPGMPANTSTIQRDLLRANDQAGSSIKMHNRPSELNKTMDTLARN